MTTERLTPATAAVDHLLLGMANLDEGIAWLEQLTGVRAMFGGSHPGAGTRNALLALGDRRYLELLAPDPAQTRFHFPLALDRLAEPRLLTWAAVTNDINQVVDLAQKANCAVQGPHAGSRTRPDGLRLHWQTLTIVNSLRDGDVAPMPFFIEWGAGTVHPSHDAPAGCTLRSLEFTHPAAADLAALFNQLGVAAVVEPASTASLRATLATPKGIITLQ